MKEKISELLVKYDMPTRQVAINEIVSLASQENSEQYLKGVFHGRNHVINAIKDLLENNENHISIISILARLDAFEAEEAVYRSKKK